MDTTTKTTVTLVNGRYDFDATEPSRGPSIILDQVRYGYVTTSTQLDAIVELSYHTGGSAYWQYLYVYSFAAGPKLVTWFQTGSRADQGLYRLMVTNGQFTLDLFDPEQRIGDCCSTGFIRTTYKWQNGKFKPAGPREYGRVEVEEIPKPRN